MLIFHVDFDMKRLGIRLKMTIKWFRVDSSIWETIILYTVHFQIKTVLFSLTYSCVHTALKIIFKNP